MSCPHGRNPGRKARWWRSGSGSRSSARRSMAWRGTLAAAVASSSRPATRRSYARSSDWVLGHPGVGSCARAARGPPRVPLRGRNEMRHARLRIGACLSLSGKYAQFGRSALRGLEAWCSLDGTADLLAEDDRSDRRVLEAVLPGVAARCDLLLGPYSTQLMRAAGRVAAESGGLV